MESNYKNLFDTPFYQSNYSPEICGFEICSVPINLIRYFYYRCLEIN